MITPEDVRHTLSTAGDLLAEHGWREGERAVDQPALNLHDAILVAMSGKMPQPGQAPSSDGFVFDLYRQATGAVERLGYPCFPGAMWKGAHGQTAGEAEAILRRAAESVAPPPAPIVVAPTAPAPIRSRWRRPWAGRVGS